MNSSPDVNRLKSCSLWACLVLAACGVDSGAALDDATTAEDAAALSASAVQVKGAATVGANRLEYFCPKTSRACRPRYVALSFNAPGGQPLRVEVTPQSAGGDAELWVTNSSYRTLGSSAPADSASAIVELVVPLLHTRPTTQLYLVVRDAKLERSTFTVRVGPPVKQRQVTQVSVGAFHSCARFDDGSVQCWGSNHTGALGDGTTTEHRSAGGPFAYKPVTAVIDGVSDISAGLNATCAVRNGQALCWGSGQAGYLGRDAPATVLQPTAVLWPATKDCSKDFDSLPARLLLRSTLSAPSCSFHA